MKKFIRFVVILIAVVVAGVLVLGVVEPKEVIVTRSIVIKAQKDVVFDQVVKFKNWPNWSPWYKMDSDKIKITYQGTDGQPGSSYHWEGSDKTGAGDTKNISVDSTKMNFEIDITRPTSFSSECSLAATDTGSGMTKVKWTCSVKMSFPWNASFVVMNWDKLLGDDFEAGLANMKKYLESHTPQIPNIEVKEVDYPAHTFEVIRKTIFWTDITKFCNDAYDLVAQDVGGKVEGTQVGVYYTWDTINHRTDCAVGFPVSDTTMPVKGTTFIHAGPSKAVMAVQKGAYNTSMQYHNAIAKYMAAKALPHTMVIEEYITGPKNEVDTNKWVTNIYYLEQ